MSKLKHAATGNTLAAIAAKEGIKAFKLVFGPMIVGTIYVFISLVWLIKGKLVLTTMQKIVLWTVAAALMGMGLCDTGFDHPEGSFTTPVDPKGVDFFASILLYCAITLFLTLIATAIDSYQAIKDELLK